MSTIQPSNPTFGRINRAIGAPRLPELQASASPIWLGRGSIDALKDRRKRRRVSVDSPYSSASVRILSKSGTPLEGHVVDLSETGIRILLDDLLPPGEAATIEFTVAGLGRPRTDGWQTFAAAVEVMRVDDLNDFPGGPYPTAFRFLRIPTMAQAQIARYVATRSAAE